MTKGEYYWINLVNMYEIYGPFGNQSEAIEHAKKKHSEPPDNGSDHYVVGIGIVQVVSSGELKVSIKSEWIEDA